MIVFNSREKIEKFVPLDFLFVLERVYLLQLKVVQRLAEHRELLEHQVEVDRRLGGNFAEIQIQI